MKDFIKDLNEKLQHLCKECGKCRRNSKDKIYPFSIWDEPPEGCGYEGWIFQQKEKKKQEIRKQKELLISLKILLKTASKDEAEKLQADIEKINKLIAVYAKYGSENW